MGLQPGYMADTWGRNLRCMGMQHRCMGLQAERGGAPREPRGVCRRECRGLQLRDPSRRTLAHAAQRALRALSPRPGLVQLELRRAALRRARLLRHLERRVQRRVERLRGSSRQRER